MESRTVFQSLRRIFICSVLAACQHPDAPVATSDREWLIAEIESDPMQAKTDVSWSKNFWQRYRSLPVPLRSNEQMARLAAFRDMDHVQAYEKGIWGKSSGAGHFAASSVAYRDPRRLYWVMVKALSEKYGCFMRERRMISNINYFRCRDRRQVVIWKNTGPGWVEFIARQYDRHGHEIHVQNHVATRTGRKIRDDLIALQD
jgi:hypothetical protein